MTMNVNTIQNFGFRNFVNLLQNLVLNTKNDITSSLMDSIILEIEKAELEIRSFYNQIASAENQDLLKYNFDSIIDNFEENGEKIENILSFLKSRKKNKKINEFIAAMDSFYTALVQCKIELNFISAELDYEADKAS